MQNLKQNFGDDLDRAQCAQQVAERRLASALKAVSAQGCNIKVCPALLCLCIPLQHVVYMPVLHLKLLLLFADGAGHAGAIQALHLCFTWHLLRVNACAIPSPLHCPSPPPTRSRALGPILPLTTPCPFSPLTPPGPFPCLAPSSPPALFTPFPTPPFLAPFPLPPLPFPAWTCKG